MNSPDALSNTAIPPPPAAASMRAGEPGGEPGMAEAEAEEEEEEEEEEEDEEAAAPAAPAPRPSACATASRFPLEKTQPATRAPSSVWRGEGGREEQRPTHLGRN